MLNKDVGFNKEQLIVINRAEALGTKMKSFKEAVKGIPGVVNIASFNSCSGHVNNSNSGYMMEGRKDETFLMETNYVDYDYLAYLWNDNLIQEELLINHIQLIREHVL